MCRLSVVSVNPGGTGSLKSYARHSARLAPFAPADSSCFSLPSALAAAERIKVFFALFDFYRNLLLLPFLLPILLRH